ncbi:hypothetical protein DdX_19697 [Ditylenchus destructor]|uniref:Uncharacterized protein n=1 Tax=Ditylenchus destructor TaxID=166010 RepID=A0AAD4MIJ7_9BILA|nr:hypothetical protein DdX_19697 [Ditylenchus destructor]
MDNGTLVEVFKFLNYCQLAKNSLKCHDRATTFIKVFTKQLSAKAYNQWAMRNQYSKQIPLEDQVGRIQSGDPLWNDMTTVFYASTKLDQAKWPLFQRFVE